MIPKILLLALVSVGAFAGEGDVLELTDDNFTAETSRLENALVMFYAPWCGHCKKLKPEYEKAASSLKGFEPKITLVKVDCTEGGKDTCNKFSVSGYPTLKIFANGDMVNDYNGPREASGIAKYMKAQVGPASKEVKDKKSLESCTKPTEVTVVGYFEKEDSKLSVEFQSAAKKLREKAQFCHVTDKKLLPKNFKDNIVLYRPVIMNNKFEPNHVEYKGEAKAIEITGFVESNYHGIVGLRTKENAAEFKNPLICAFYNIDYVKNPKGTNYWRNRVLKVAEKNSKFNFCISNKDEFQQELNEFGLDYVKDDKPVILARNEENKKFVMKDEFSIEAFEKFVKDFENGKIEPYIKSEEVPKDNTGPVKVAVAKNFDEIVMNSDRDALVEFYAPWCGHCRKLSPILEEVGKSLADEEVDIFKFDATANDVPSGYEVRGFPTMFWLPKDDKKNPLPYNGGREAEDFIKYIAEHATNQLKGFDRKGKPVKAAGSDEL